MRAQILKQIVRNVTCYSGQAGSHKASGALLPSPHVTQFVPIKILSILFPSIMFGAMLSKNGASFLEENEIFVPEADDD